MVLLGGFTLALSALVLPTTALPNQYKRDILGLLHGDAGTSSLLLTPDLTRVILPTPKAFTSSSLSSFEKPSPSTSQSQWTPIPTDSSASTSIKTTLASTPSILPASAESRVIDHSSKTWQIVGIAIISVLFIATSITCAMFFDRLWRFLKDVIGCTSHPLASEEFIPDCETQSWDTRTLSPSPSDLSHYKGESLREEASVYTRARELPWNADSQDWNTLHRQPSRRNDGPPSA